MQQTLEGKWVPLFQEIWVDFFEDLGQINDLEVLGSENIPFDTLPAVPRLPTGTSW